MNYSEMLHEFLDSSLNGTGEETLFHALASDEELRFEMKYLLKLRDSVRDDEEARVVPISSTNAIFAQLGYTAPAIVGAGGAIAGSQIGFLSLMKTAGGYVLAMLVGALITTGVFMMTTSSDETQLATKGTGQVSGQKVPPQSRQFQVEATPGTSTQQVQVVPPATGGSGTELTPQRLSATTTAQQNSGRNIAAAQRSKVVPATPSNSDGTEVSPSDAKIDGNGVTKVGSETPIITESQPKTVLTLDATAPKQERLIDSTLQISNPEVEQRSSDLKLEVPATPPATQKERRLATFSASVRASVVPFELKTPVTSLQQATTIADNVAASISYSVSPNFAFLLEGGKESFLLTFNERKADGRTIQHEVFPTVFWGGVGLRYTPVPQWRFSPFMQVVGGGSEAGFIGRGLVGLQWSITEQLGIMSGFEYTTAMYRFQDDVYTSPKFGVTGGITLNLFGN